MRPRSVINLNFLHSTGCNGNQFTPLGGSVAEGFDDIFRPELGRDYQELKIQEQIHRLPVGHFPSSVWVVCFDDLVDGCKAGDDVTVTGDYWEPYRFRLQSDLTLLVEP